MCVCIQIILIMNITLRRQCDETNCWISTQSKNSIRGGFPRIARGCHYSIRKNIKLNIIIIYCCVILLSNSLLSSLRYTTRCVAMRTR